MRLGEVKSAGRSGVALDRDEAGGRGEESGKGFGNMRRQNEGRSFSFCRFEGVPSRTGVRLGSPAKRPLRKIQALILPGAPAFFQILSRACHACGERTRDGHKMGRWDERNRLWPYEKRHLRKMRGLFPRETPSNLQRNPRHPRPADSGHGNPGKSCSSPQNGTGSSRETPHQGQEP